MAEKIKLGIIGMGNMGKDHSKNVAINNKCPSVELVAVADIDPKPLAWAKENLPESVTLFDDAEKMMDSGLVTNRTHSSTAPCSNRSARSSGIPLRCALY